MLFIISLLFVLIINEVTSQCSRLTNLSTTDTNSELIFSSASKLNNNNNQYQITLHQYQCGGESLSCSLCSINDVKWEVTLQPGYELCIQTLPATNGKCHNGTDVYAFHGSSTTVCNTPTPCVRYSQCDPIPYLSSNVAVYRNVKSVTKINYYLQQGVFVSTSYQVQLMEATIPFISCSKVATAFSSVEVSESVATNLCVRNPLPEDYQCNGFNVSDACVLASSTMDCAPGWTRMPLTVTSETVTLAPTNSPTNKNGVSNSNHTSMTSLLRSSFIHHGLVILLGVYIFEPLFYMIHI
jgi:hypothetical protein